MLLSAAMYLPALISALLFAAVSAAGTSTVLVALTSTRTVYATATDHRGACDDFYGACVVYGSRGNAPWTTTVYRNHPTWSTTSTPTPTSLVTSTTTVLATTTAANSNACSGFVGACVVYATSSGAAATSTVYYAGGNNGHDGVGNSQGYIGPKVDDGSGVIGSAATAVRRPFEAMVCLGAMVAAFAFWV